MLRSALGIALRATPAVRCQAGAHVPAPGWIPALQGTAAAFISAGGYHHHIGLNTWESKGGSPPPPGTTGLFHTAILYPSRPALADALYRVIEAGIELDGASDHGVSEALYLRDPDQNGVELYRDRPKEEWPRAPDGSLAMFTKRLDLEELLRARVT